MEESSSKWLGKEGTTSPNQQNTVYPLPKQHWECPPFSSNDIMCKMEDTSSYSYSDLVSDSEAYIRQLLHQILPETRVYLFGSRARGDAGKASDFDIWLDAEIDPATLAKIQDQLDESFVPFPVNIVTSPDLKGEFGEQVKKDAIQWN